MSQRGRHDFAIFYLAFTISRGVASLIIPLYFVSVGIPVIGVGVAIGVFGGSLLVSEILWGIFIDRRGSGWLVFAAVVITSATYVLLPLVKTPPGAIGVEFVLGISAPIPTLVGRANVARQAESTTWAGGFGVLGAAYAVAQLVGSLLGSISIPSLGLVYSFYISAAISLLSYLVYIRYGSLVSTGRVVGEQDSQAMTKKSKEDDEDRRPPGRPHLDWRGLPLLSLVAIPNYITFAFFTNIMQLVVVKTPAIHGTAFEAGIVVSSFWLSTAIFQPLLSWKAARNARVWIGVAMAASFLTYALMTQLYSVPEVAVGAFIAGACYSAISPLSLSLLMLGIPTRFVGRAMGIYGAAEDIGVIIGPLVGSAVWVEFGLVPAYLTLGASFLLVLIPYAVGMRTSASPNPGTQEIKSPSLHAVPAQ